MEVSGNERHSSTEDFFGSQNVSDFGGQGTVEEDYFSQGGSPTTNEEVEPVTAEETEEAKKPNQTSKQVESKKEEFDVKVTTNDFFDNQPKEPEAEEEEEEEKTTNPTPKVEEVETEEETEDDDSEAFSALAQSLFEYGIFTKTEEDDDNPIKGGEQLKERWEREKEIQVNSRITDFIMSQHGEEGLEVFKSIFVSGAPIKDFLSKYSQIESLADIDLTTESNQEYIYRMYHKGIGWSDERIEKKLERDKNYGDLEEDVKGYHEMLLEQEQKQLSKMAQEAELRNQQRAQYEAEYSQRIADIVTEKNKKRDFDGIPVTDKVARETYSYLVDKTFRIPSTGELITTFDKDLLDLRKPENYELKVKMALLLRNQLDLSKVKTKGVSETTDKLFSKVVRQSKPKPNKQSTSHNDNSTFWEGL